MDVLKKVLEVLRPILDQVKSLLGLGFDGIKGFISSLTSGDGFKSLLNGENIRQKIVTALLFFGVLFSFTRCGGDDAKDPIAELESTSVKSEVADLRNPKTLFPKEGLEADAKTADELSNAQAAKELLDKQEEDKKKAEAKVEQEKIEAEKLVKVELEAKLQEEMDARERVWLDERKASVAAAMEVVQEQNKMIAISRDDLELQKQNIAQEIGAKSDILEKILGASALLTTKQAAFETDFSKSQESIKLKFAELQKARESFDEDRGNFDETKAGIDNAQSELEEAKTKLAKDIEVFELEKSKFSEELAAFEKQNQDLNATRIEFDKSRLTYEQDLLDLNTTQGEIATKKQELEALVSKNEIALQEIEKAKELAAHQSEFDNASNAREKEEENEKFALLSKAKEDLNATNVSLRADLDTLKADLEKANESVQSAGTQAESDLESANAQLDILKADLNATKADLEKANESVQSAGTQAKSDLESANAQLDILKADLNATKADLEKANESVQSADTQAKSDLESANAQLDILKADLNATKADLEKANESVQSAGTQAKSDLESANVQLDKSRELLESTKTELVDANQKLQSASDAAKVALVAATAGATKYKVDLDNANAQIQRLKSEGEALLKEQQEREAARLKASQLEDQKKAILEKISLADVKFKYNSTDLYPSSQQRLDGIATFIKENSGYNYEIQGHTDARGHESYNLKLSASRAEAVKAYLVGQGVDGGTLTARGFGSSVPIADNSTNEGRLKNRRVVFEILD